MNGARNPQIIDMIGFLDTSNLSGMKIWHF